MAVTSAAVRTVTAGVHRHWLLGPIEPNVNNAGLRRGLRQPIATVYNASAVTSYPFVPRYRARPLGQVRRWQLPPVYRPLVDLSTMEERHVIVTYRLDCATIQELCAQLEPDLISAIRHPRGIIHLVQVLSVLHFLVSGSFQTTVAIASGMSQPMFSNVLSRVLSALLKHMRSYIVFPQVKDLPTVKDDFYALGHIPNIIGAIDGTHVALVPSAGVNRCTETGRATIH
ncbi:hypothetical protein NDU88_005847 [Pleurodeles waltl]|uniref:Nuclease HARBI1 n=1 Tax=Pleurodeles waltl TaxID=8319 RepID=A0AAV7PPQ1_PLEWA|nr:hypothetical protein NDU88_005847 [Pleurodeles waltl]